MVVYKNQWYRQEKSAAAQFLDWTRTLGSPRSLRLRSFSCRLLTVSFASVPASASADAPEPPRPKPSIGDITELQSLKTAYSGIWHATQSLSTPHRLKGMAEKQRRLTTRYSHHTQSPNAPLASWHAQVMYTTSKAHSMMPGRERSSPAEMSAPVVGSRRGEPMRSR